MMVWLSERLALFAVANRTIRADKSGSYITYKAVHALHAWKGINRQADCIIVYNDESGRIEKVAVAAKVADFDSNNSNRDSHALEVLEALKYPKITFVSTSVTYRAEGQAQVQGNLTFHGITRAVSFPVELGRNGKNMTVKGGFSIQLTDYQVERPSFMLVPIDDKMELEFYMQFGI
jgi:polyisoprenoid-binding protein YceI